MIISRLILKNWRNFKAVDIQLGQRAFIVGPNASGKSNLLDAIRFMRDIVKPGGGLQDAVRRRGGVTKIRNLAARRDPVIEMAFHLSDQKSEWIYSLGIQQFQRGRTQSLPKLAFEKVMKGDKQILNRPDSEDDKDDLRLTQTHLEQVGQNFEFRDIVDFFSSVSYLHLVPQLLRHTDAFTGPGIPDDPYGRGLLERIARTPEKTRRKRLEKIEQALSIAVPQLKKLTDVKDEAGTPHLEAIYEHWRPQGAKQREDQFSDGTLRLIGLLWSLLESDNLLLLEEPELSLHAEIVSKLPALIYRITRSNKRQVFISTHSKDLLGDKGIASKEIIVLTPDSEGTRVVLADSIGDIKNLLEGGMSPGEAIVPKTAPKNAYQLGLFE